MVQHTVPDFYSSTFFFLSFFKFSLCFLGAFAFFFFYFNSLTPLPDTLEPPALILKSVLIISFNHYRTAYRVFPRALLPYVQHRFSFRKSKLSLFLFIFCNLVISDKGFMAEIMEKIIQINTDACKHAHSILFINDMRYYNLIPLLSLTKRLKEIVSINGNAHVYTDARYSYIYQYARTNTNTRTLTHTNILVDYHTLKNLRIRVNYSTISRTHTNAGESIQALLWSGQLCYIGFKNRLSFLLSCMI